MQFIWKSGVNSEMQKSWDLVVLIKEELSEVL
jgi:hypothetical protein